jgi:hypothetical protein
MIFSLWFLLAFITGNHSFGFSNSDFNYTIEDLRITRPVPILNQKQRTSDNSSSIDHVKIAFFGDQGLSSASEKLLSQIREWDPHCIVHLGDFDYNDSPILFQSLIYSKLGRSNFPYLGLIGNHEVEYWNEYEKVLVDLLKNGHFSQNCRGQYGVNMVCNINGVIIVLSGVGTLGKDHAKFIDDALSANPSSFKICSWHKNQHAYQLGNKPDETGYGVYEICRKHGAIIATAHHHTYGRTFVMSNFENQTIASNRDASHLNIKPGETFTFHAGTGGRDLKRWKHGLEKNEWWASVASRDNGLNFGALYCKFFTDDSSEKAKCKYVDIDGNEFDRFHIHSSSMLNTITDINICDYPIIETLATNVDDVDYVFIAPPATGRFLLQGESFYSDLAATKFVFDNQITGNISAVYLQLFGHEAHGDADLVIQGLHDDGARTNASVEWFIMEEVDEKETEIFYDEVEKGTVWNTPNISSIINELLRNGNKRFQLLISTSQVNGSFSIRGGKKPHLKPTLRVEFEKVC